MSVSRGVGRTTAGAGWARSRVGPGETVHPTWRARRGMSSRHTRPSASCSSVPAQQRDSHQLNMITKPPKPPCWRDFLPDAARPRRAPALPAEQPGYVDLGRGGGSDAGERAARLHRKHRIKLHRTQSELTIQQTHLPESGALTVSLADTRPREFGLRKRTTPTPVVCLDENAARCERWLAGVHASQPLHDFAFARGAGVDVEVPEENLAALGRVALRRTGSSSGSDVDSASVCAMRMRAIHGGSDGKRAANRNGRKSPPKHHLAAMPATECRHSVAPPGGGISQQNARLSPRPQTCALGQSRLATAATPGDQDGSSKENRRPATDGNRSDRCVVDTYTDTGHVTEDSGGTQRNVRVYVTDDHVGTRHDAPGNITEDHGGNVDIVHEYVTDDSGETADIVHGYVTQDRDETADVVHEYMTEDHDGTADIAHIYVTDDHDESADIVHGYVTEDHDGTADIVHGYVTEDHAGAQRECLGV